MHTGSAEAGEGNARAFDTDATIVTSHVLCRVANRDVHLAVCTFPTQNNIYMAP